MSHQQSVCCKCARGKCAARIEAKPANPKQRSTNDCKRDIVRYHDIRAKILSATKNKCSGKRAQSGTSVYYNTACKVKDSHVCEPPSPPDPVGKRVVDDY